MTKDFEIKYYRQHAIAGGIIKNWLIDLTMSKAVGLDIFRGYYGRNPQSLDDVKEAAEMTRVIVDIMSEIIERVNRDRRSDWETHDGMVRSDVFDAFEEKNDPDDESRMNLKEETES